MKKKYRLKKSAIIILVSSLIILIALISFIISLLKTKSYSVEYNLDEYEISENYNSEKKYYYYEITNSKNKYNFIYQSEYLKEKKLIKEIKEYNDEKYTCITIRSDYVTSYPMCSYQNKLIDYHLVSEKMQTKIADYYKETKILDKEEKNYHIFNNDNELLLWSYKGFNIINKSGIKYVEIFDKDIYEIPLATKINNYIFIPDYEQEYTFNKIYLLNLENNKVETWKIKHDISFDSYILGTNEKSIYLIDQKNKIEYELVPHKQKMRIIANKNKKGIIYEKGNINRISMNKLINKKHAFTYDRLYNFNLKNSELYMTYIDSNLTTKVSNKKIDTIISINDESVYYLIDNTLYRYNQKYGEVKIISYADWEFNYKNLIFIND